jgi:hypothetical protein
MIDATGVFAIKELFEELRSRGIATCAVGRESEWADWAAARGFEERLAQTRFFSSLGQATGAYLAEHPEAAAKANDGSDRSDATAADRP